MPLFALLTLFPEALAAYTRTSILGLAQDKGLVRIELVDFRDFTRDRHRSVDDRPFGGGPGMVLKAEPIAECVEWLERRHGSFRKIALSPAGPVFKQSCAESLATCERVLLLCGRYEGFDQRILTRLDFEELSIGDFVLAGGELPALLVVEAVTRLVPGVLGDDRSAEQDSFREDGWLDCPHYTRPRVFRGESVPEALLSGDHESIRRWREQSAQARTHERRPDVARRASALEHSSSDRGWSGQPSHRWNSQGNSQGNPRGHLHAAPIQRTAAASQRPIHEAEPERLRNEPCT